MKQMILSIIGVVILLAFFPMVLDSVHEIRTDEQTDSALALTGTPPAGACVLTEDLWNDDTGSVLSVVGDAPETLTVVSYTAATNTLNVTGVTTSTTAAVVYEISALDDFTGMDSFAGMTPLLVYLGFLALLLGSAFFGAKRQFGF